MQPGPASSGHVDAPKRRIKVLLPLPLEGAYDYGSPPESPGKARLEAGDFVLVPLGRREQIGVVWGEGGTGPGAIAEERLKDIAHRFDLPKLPAVVRRFVDWVANYTLNPPGAVLRMAMSVSAVFGEGPRPAIGYRLAPGVSPDSPPPEGVKLTPRRRRVLEIARAGARPLSEIAREAGVGAGVARALADAGLLESVVIPDAPAAPPDGSRPGPALSEDQQAAADELKAKIERGSYSATLLDGVTGSGKTEVYFEAIAATLRRGEQALVLLPESALTASWLERFAARSGAPPTEWHSELSAKQRRANLLAVAKGEASAVVGARSALFLPYPKLGLIVVD